MKYLLGIIILFSSASIVKGQGNKRSSYHDQTFLISIGANAGLPIGNNGNSFSYNLAGDLQAEYKITPDVSITANGSYISFKKKDLKVNAATDYKGTIAFKTGMLGAKYTFLNDVFFHVQIGIASSAAVVGTKVCYAPGVGYDFSRNFDIELKYMGIRGAGDLNGSLSTINIRVGYSF